MNHTPGPWKLRNDGPPFNDICGPNGKIIATAFPHYHDPLKAIAIAEANARLIAAAPEMLAALQQAIARADKNLERYDSRDEECQKDYDLCVAAIVKATGAPP